MPRRARLKIAGFPLHIVQRGNNRSPCFMRAGDYGVYLGLLDELANLFGCAIHAYVLMTNHVHLLLTPDRHDGASNLMKHLGQRYVQYVNRTHKRSGSLWEGRFRSSIVDSSCYLLRCHRYIELNPVRAGMVSQPNEYPWSSFGTNAMGVPSTIIVPHAEYVALGRTDEDRRKNYLVLFETAPNEDELRRIRDAAKGGFALGSETFLADVTTRLGRRACRAWPS